MLPPEIILIITNNCNGKDVIALSKTCKDMRFLLNESRLWQKCLFREFCLAINRTESYEIYTNICSIFCKTIVEFSLPSTVRRYIRQKQVSESASKYTWLIVNVLAEYSYQPIAVLEIVKTLINEIYRANRKNAKVFTMLLAQYYAARIDKLLLKKLYKRLNLFEPEYGCCIFVFKKLGRRHFAEVKYKNYTIYGAILHVFLRYLHHYVEKNI
jgi:hypothetical protein